MIFGLCEHQKLRLRLELQKAIKHADDPLLVPSIWLNLYGETRARRTEARHMAIRDIQKRCGLHWTVDISEARFRDQDFDGITYELTVLGNELSWDGCAITALLTLGEKLKNQHNKSFGTVNTESHVLGRLNFAIDLLTGAKAHNVFLSSEISTQLRTVSRLVLLKFALIASRLSISFSSGTTE